MQVTFCWREPTQIWCDQLSIGVPDLDLAFLISHWRADEDLVLGIFYWRINQGLALWIFYWRTD